MCMPCSLALKSCCKHKAIACRTASASWPGASWREQRLKDMLCVCVHCCVLQEAITDAVRDCLTKAGHGRHILNLGHGVLVGTPEENVAHMFDLSKQLKYADLPLN